MEKKKLIFPLLLVTFVVLQCFSSPVNRPKWMSYAQIDDEDDDMEEEYNPRLHIPDSVLMTWTADSLRAYSDSIMALYPIDSMVLYEEPVLLDAPDSIQAHVDSVFYSIFKADSLAKAKIAFQHWFDSLPKKEQKKWITENVTIPMQKRKMDSILHIKDSIQAYKDSVIQNTPRILETTYIPDSMFYKRIIVLTQDKFNGEFKTADLDTSYNYHFYDYPFLRKDVNATWLGVAGGPLQYYDADKRDEEANVLFFSPLRAWTYDSSDAPSFNTKTPATELAYYGNPFGATNQEEINLRFMTTQNITPELNATFELNKWGAGGNLQRQHTTSYHLNTGVNYLGRKYALHAGWLHDNDQAQENGGVAHLSDIRDTTLNSRELEVNLSNAESNTKRDVVYLNQNFRIPLGRDSLTATTAFIGHSSEFSSYRRTYNDNITNSYGRAFYRDVFNLNPSRSNDTLGVMKLDNKVYMRLQPWKEDFYISKIDVGIGDKLVRYTSAQKNEDSSVSYGKVFENNVYAYAGANGMVSKYFDWNARGRITFLGYEAGDFDIDANAVFSMYPFRRNRKAPIKIGANFSTRLTAADYYMQHMLLNHFAWENDFSKRSDTRISGFVDIPSWKFRAEASYNIMANTVYFDNLGIIRQSDHPVNVIGVNLREEFVLWKFHLDNRVLLQFSSDNEVMPVPLVALNLRYYLQIEAVKNVLQMQLGANMLYNTKWNLPAYNPNLGVFYNQNEMAMGNCPIIDVFVNMQWKKACIFIKMENIGNGWPLKKGKDYFTSYGYIHAQRHFENIKFGIFWPFYVKPAKDRGHAAQMHNHNHGHAH